MTRSLTN